jgi:hypothetical protein
MYGGACGGGTLLVGEAVSIAVHVRGADGVPRALSDEKQISAYIVFPDGTREALQHEGGAVPGAALRLSRAALSEGAGSGDGQPGQRAPGRTARAAGPSSSNNNSHASPTSSHGTAVVDGAEGEAATLYELRHVASRVGPHTVHVSLNGVPLEGAPVTFEVASGGTGAIDISDALQPTSSFEGARSVSGLQLKARPVKKRHKRTQKARPNGDGEGGDGALLTPITPGTSAALAKVEELVVSRGLPYMPIRIPGGRPGGWLGPDAPLRHASATIRGSYGRFPPLFTETPRQYTIDPSPSAREYALVARTGLPPLADMLASRVAHGVRLRSLD